MIGRIAFYLQQPSKYSYVQLRLVLNSYVWIYVSVSPQSRNATTATSQVIVLTKRHFLALSFQAPLKAENSYILVRVRGLEPPRIAALEPKSSVSTNSTILAHGAPTRTRTADLLITNQLLYQLSYRGINVYFYLSLWKMINIFWKRAWDSNPWNAMNVRRISNPLPSTTRPALLITWLPLLGSNQRQID